MDTNIWSNASTWSPILFMVLCVIMLICALVLIGIAIVAWGVRQQYRETLSKTREALLGSQEALVTSQAINGQNVQLLVHTDEFRIKIAQELAEIAAVGRSTHILVNSNMSNQLRINMIATRRLAELTHHPDDLIAARLAEETYKNHMQKQVHADIVQSTAANTQDQRAIPAN